MSIGRRLLRFLLTATAVLATVTGVLTTAQAQSHHFQHGDAPLGEVGQIQRMARDAEYGRYDEPQSVQVIGPEGCSIAYWDGSEFTDPQTSSRELAMMVGNVYQLKISDIPEHPGVELYPTVELINRLYPPAELTETFSVIVEMPMADLNQAIEGKLVTRVVYLEDPNTAMPYQQSATEQPFFDVHPQEDVLQVAQRLGRPMAIVRIGSRIPDHAMQNR